MLVAHADPTNPIPSSCPNPWTKSRQSGIYLKLANHNPHIAMAALPGPRKVPVLKKIANIEPIPQKMKWVDKFSFQNSWTKAYIISRTNTAENPPIKLINSDTLPYRSISFPARKNNQRMNEYPLATSKVAAYSPQLYSNKPTKSWIRLSLRLLKLRRHKVIIPQRRYRLRKIAIRNLNQGS